MVSGLKDIQRGVNRSMIHSMIQNETKSLKGGVKPLSCSAASTQKGVNTFMIHCLEIYGPLVGGQS